MSSTSPSTPVETTRSMESARRNARSAASHSCHSTRTSAAAASLRARASCAIERSIAMTCAPWRRERDRVRAAARAEIEHALAARRRRTGAGRPRSGRPARTTTVSGIDSDLVRTTVAARCGPRSPSSCPGDSSWPHSGPTRRLRAGSELLDHPVRVVVVVLHRRRLHEVRRRAEQRTTDAAVEGDLRAAHRVDDHAGRVRRVPDLELQLDVQRARRRSCGPPCGCRPTSGRSATARGRTDRCARDPS